MQHLTFPGGWYADHLPSGEWCVLKANRRVLTHLGELPEIPNDYPLFLDSTNVGGYKLAGKGHDSFTTWEWLGSWVPREEAIGNFSVIYDHTGTLHISKAGPVGVQGWRQEFEGVLITGDESYGPLVTSTSPPNGLTEFSKLGDGVFIGQGWQTGGVCVWDGTTLRLLLPGACYDVKAKRLGNTVAIAFYDVEPDGLTAHIFTATIDELRFLPPVVAPLPQPPPIQTPPPEPPPVSTPQAPNEFAVVQRVFAAHPEIDRVNEDTRGRAVDYVIAELGGKPWGRKSKNKEGTNLNTDGLTYLRTDGRYEIYDIIDGTTGKATWDGGDPVVQGENGWWAPGLPVGGVTPGPLPNPSSPSSFATAAAGLEAQVKGIAAAVDALKAIVTELKNRPVVEPKAVNLDGARIALKTDNGHFVSAQDGGGGVIHTQRPVPGEPVDGYQPGGWETFTIVAR